MSCVSLCVLFIVNLVVSLVGIAVVSLASYVLHTTEAYNQLFMEGITMLPVWTLIGGLCLTILGFFGFFGVVMKSPWMLRVYGGLVLVFFIMELVCGILLIVWRNEAPEYLQDKMRKSFEHYNEDEALARSIDIAQNELQCCGVLSYQEWFYILGRPDVTPGCCRPDSGVDADECYKNINLIQTDDVKQRIYTQGCYNSMVEDLSDETLALAVMALLLVMVQLTCITFACTIASQMAELRRKKKNVQMGDDYDLNAVNYH